MWKDHGKGHFKIMHKGITPEEFRAARAAYEFVRRDPMSGRTQICKADLYKKVYAFYMQYLYPLNVSMARVLAYMLASGNYLPNGYFVVGSGNGRGLDRYRAEALWNTIMGRYTSMRMYYRAAKLVFFEQFPTMRMGVSTTQGKAPGGDLARPQDRRRRFREDEVLDADLSDEEEDDDEYKDIPLDKAIDMARALRAATDDTDEQLGGAPSNHSHTFNAPQQEAGSWMAPQDVQPGPSEPGPSEPGAAPSATAPWQIDVQAQPQDASMHDDLIMDEDEIPGPFERYDEDSEVDWDEEGFDAPHEGDGV